MSRLMLVDLLGPVVCLQEHERTVPVRVQLLHVLSALPLACATRLPFCDKVS